jgi:hypothetical protein
MWKRRMPGIKSRLPVCFPLATSLPRTLRISGTLLTKAAAAGDQHSSRPANINGQGPSHMRLFTLRRRSP